MSAPSLHRESTDSLIVVLSKDSLIKGTGPAKKNLCRNEDKYLTRFSVMHVY